MILSGCCYNRLVIVAALTTTLFGGYWKVGIHGSVVEGSSRRLLAGRDTIAAEEYGVIIVNKGCRQGNVGKYESYTLLEWCAQPK